MDAQLVVQADALRAWLNFALGRMNTAEVARGIVIVASAVALAFVGLHAALTASNWFAGSVVLPLLKGEENLRFYVLVGGHAAFVAASLAIGIALSYATANRAWLGAVAFITAVAFFASDWEQEGGSFFGGLFDITVVVYATSVLTSAYLVKWLRRGHAA